MINVLYIDRMWNRVDLFRQTINTAGKAGSCSFGSDITQSRNYDYVVMSPQIEFLSISLQFARERRILFVMENPSIWRIPQEVVESAGIIVSPFKEYANNSAKFYWQNGCIPWFYGINFCTNSGLTHNPKDSAMDLGSMISVDNRRKTKLLSVVMSSKSGSHGYKWRQDLCSGIKKYFGRDCDVFGFGHKPLSDKRLALDSYAFTLAVENSSSDLYWTEKLADALIGRSYPLYSGASKVNDEFISDFNCIPFGCAIEDAIRVVSRIVSLYSSDYRRIIEENRHHLLLHHNIFYTVNNIVTDRDF